jgi:DNA-binding transcriptional LysR family regulator
MDTVDGMRAFVAVAHQQSFTAAARQLGISTKLASKYVGQLETRLGAQLLHRTTRSVRLTDTGKAYLERCVPLLDEFDELEGLVQLRQSELAGRIRITAPTAFGSRELVDAIRPFQSAHPKVTIDLHLSDQRVSIIDEGFDLAIRFGLLEDSSLIARKLLDMRVVVFAAVDYLEQHGTPQHPRALQTHNCVLQTTSAHPEQWTFIIDGERETVEVNGNFQANSPRAVTEMVAGGYGFGMCPLYVVEPFLKTRQVRLLFESCEATVFPLYAIYPSSRHLTARIRALIDYLATHFS